MNIDKHISSMEKKTPGISHKATKRFLCEMCGGDVKKDAAAKKLIDEIAKRSEMAYEIGKKDGLEGRPKQRLEKLINEKTLSEFQKNILEFAHASYSGGYTIGEALRKNRKGARK